MIRLTILYLEFYFSSTLAIPPDRAGLTTLPKEWLTFEETFPPFFDSLNSKLEWRMYLQKWQKFLNTLIRDWTKWESLVTEKEVLLHHAWVKCCMNLVLISIIIRILGWISTRKIDSIIMCSSLLIIIIFNHTLQFWTKIWYPNWYQDTNGYRSNWSERSRFILERFFRSTILLGASSHVIFDRTVKEHWTLFYDISIRQMNPLKYFRKDKQIITNNIDHQLILFSIKCRRLRDEIQLYPHQPWFLRIVFRFQLLHSFFFLFEFYGIHVKHSCQEIGSTKNHDVQSFSPLSHSAGKVYDIWSFLPDLSPLIGLKIKLIFWRNFHHHAPPALDIALASASSYKFSKIFCSLMSVTGILSDL